MSIKLYKHNKETYEKMIEKFQTDSRVGVVQPTGTGKSFLILKWIEDHPKDDFILLAPSREIFTQLQEYANEAYNEEKEISMLSRISMITYQELIRMSQDDFEKLSADKIILDEFHRTGAEQWGPAVDILLAINNKAKVLGLSATPIRYLDNAKDMALELFDRNLAREMTLGEAVAKGILPEPIYVPVWYDMDKKNEKYQLDIRMVQNTKERVELEKELEKAKRHLEKAYGPEEIFENYMPNKHGKYIVFCRGREHLKEILPVVKSWLLNVNSKTNIYISLSGEKDKEKQLQAFRENNDDSAIKLLFTVDRLNEGIHVKGIDGVIMLRPTTSPIIYLQQMGRALASGKNSPVIFDMVNNYLNVQTFFLNAVTDENTINVFEKEFKDACHNLEEIERFKVFEKMMDFNQIFKKIDYILYPDRENIWLKWFDLYKEIKDTKGREPRQTEIYKGQNIGMWCATQRQQYKQKILPLDREQILRDAGFEFNPLETQWLNNFELYKEFKLEKGREPKKEECYKGVSIGIWCRSQRKEYKKRNLSFEKEKQLREFGFIFDWRGEQWNRKLELYKEFKKEKGREPKKKECYKGVNLESWVKEQVTLYNKGKLGAEKEKLFWEVREFGKKGSVHIETQWTYTFELYKEFKLKNGREPRQTDTYKGVNIGAWCTRIKRTFNKQKLIPEKEKLLREAGFDFNPLETQWLYTFELYKEFKLKNGREPRQTDTHKGVNIGMWCKNQRSLYNKGKLSPKREKLLRDAGFRFDNLSSKTVKEKNY